MPMTGDRLVDAYFSKSVATSPPRATRAEVFATMAERDVSAIPIVENDKLLGIVSLGDLLRNPGPPDEEIDRVMRKDVVSVAPGTTLREAARAMLSNNIHRVLIVENGVLRGVLATREIMRAIAQDRIETPLGAVMTSPVMSVDVRDPIGFTLDLLARSRVHGVLVTDRGQPAGVFTQAEALRAQKMPAMAPVEDFMSHSLLQLPKETPAHRAASFAVATRARRILAMEGAKMAGIATGIDLIRLVAQSM